MVGGEYSIVDKECWCYDNLYCLEPCIGLEDTGVEFSTRPLSDFGKCEKSFCNYFNEDYKDFCSKMKWNPESCDAKIMVSKGEVLVKREKSVAAILFSFMTIIILLIIVGAAIVTRKVASKSKKKHESKNVAEDAMAS